MKIGTQQMALATTAMLVFLMLTSLNASTADAEQNLDQVGSVIPSHLDMRGENTTITTTLICNAATMCNATTISTSDFAFDSATLSGASSDAGGTVTYTVYSDNTCTTFFADAGMKTVTNGNVPLSDPVTFNSAGTFYWQASYSGDSKNNPATSTCTSEPVTVNASNLQVTTVADSATINPGDRIGFTVGVTNNGAGTVANVSLTGQFSFSYYGVNWSIESTTGSPACSILLGPWIPGFGPLPYLDCRIVSLDSSASFSVHVVSSTPQDGCEVYDMYVYVTSANGGSARNYAPSIIAQCGIIFIEEWSGGENGTFTFIGTGGDGLPANFQITTPPAYLDEGGNQSFIVEPGRYTVSETVPAGWTLTSAVCDIWYQGPDSEKYSNQTPDNLTVPAGGTVRCYFTNAIIPVIPEYPFGLAMVFMATTGIYVIIRRRVVK